MLKFLVMIIKMTIHSLGIEPGNELSIDFGIHYKSVFEFIKVIISSRMENKNNYKSLGRTNKNVYTYDDISSVLGIETKYIYNTNERNNQIPRDLVYISALIFDLTLKQCIHALVINGSLKFIDARDEMILKYIADGVNKNINYVDRYHEVNEMLKAKRYSPLLPIDE